MMTEQALKKNKEISEQYKSFLCPEGNLVAVKMLKDLDGWEDIKRLKRPRTLCQAICQTRYIGRSILIGPGENACYAVDACFFGKEMPPDAHKMYVGWQFSSEEAAKKTFEVLPKFGHEDGYKAIALIPLEKCPVDPDAVIIFGNASQMLVLYGAYLRTRGGDMLYRAGNNGTCLRLIVSAIKEQEPKLVVPGNAMKMLGLPSNTDLIFSIPGFLLEEIAENAWLLRKTGGSRYPVAWQHIDWDIQPPISSLLQKGGPDWVKK